MGGGGSGCVGVGECGCGCVVSGAFHENTIIFHSAEALLQGCREQRQPCSAWRIEWLIHIIMVQLL